MSPSAKRPSPRPPCTTTRSSPQTARVLLSLRLVLLPSPIVGVNVDFSSASSPQLSSSSNATATAPMRAGGEPHRAERQERCMFLDYTSWSEREQKRQKTGGERMPLLPHISLRERRRTENEKSTPLAELSSPYTDRSASSSPPPPSLPAPSLSHLPQSNQNNQTNERGQ